MMDASALVPDVVRHRLSSLVTYLGSNPRQISRELDTIPVTVIDALLDEHDRWEGEERATLLEVLAHDPRDYVRVEVAARASAIGEPILPLAERILSHLCCDEVRAVRQTAASSLAVVLQGVEGFTRTRIVGSWALSNFRGQRVAIAQALRWPFEVVGATSAIELLAGDDDPEVRIAAAEAAKIRLKDAPSMCSAILRRLATDPDTAVRRAVGIDSERIEISEAGL